MTLKERIEQNVVVWLLGTLLTGFLSGVVTYRSVQEIGGIEPVSKWRIQQLENSANDAQKEAEKIRAELDRANTAIAALKEQTKRYQAAGPQTRSAVEKPTQGLEAAKSKPRSKADPAVRGHTIAISFRSESAKTALAAKQRLEAIGLRIKMEEWNYEPTNSAPNTVYYYGDNLAAATAVTEALADFGVVSTKEATWKPSQEMVIWLR